MGGKPTPVFLDVLRNLCVATEITAWIIYCIIIYLFILVLVIYIIITISEIKYYLGFTSINSHGRRVCSSALRRGRHDAGTIWGAQLFAAEKQGMGMTHPLLKNVVRQGMMSLCAAEGPRSGNCIDTTQPFHSSLHIKSEFHLLVSWVRFEPVIQSLQ